MIKLILPAIFFVILASCTKKESPSNEIEVENVSAPEVVLSPIEEGKSLIEGGSCLACHKVDETMIGPAYKEVAAKYENTPENVTMLADRIIKGSVGVWGNVPMTAHHGLSQKNAEFMATYILSLK